MSLASPSPKLLHDRLGHPHLSKLKRITPEFSKLQVLEWDSCQLGKHIWSSFPKRTKSRCNSVFSIIHSNISGPSQVSSFGYRYFLTFIDEYSSCYRVYLMKDRSELLNIF